MVNVAESEITSVYRIRNKLKMKEIRTKNINDMQMERETGDFSCRRIPFTGKYSLFQNISESTLDY